jgi:uncharacterized protein
MYSRCIVDELIETAAHYPVVALLGPRQSGKTTIVTAVFKDKAYVSLEDPDERLLAETDPRAFLARFPKGAILDEVQRVPELLSYIQTIVDKAGQNGLFILTGSHQMQLQASISQSLAGRIGLLSLYPLSMAELKLANIELTLDSQILHGFYPRVYNEHLNPTKAYRNYLHTYVEKDVRAISEIKNLVLFQKFLKLCAGRIGRILDYTSLSSEVGVSVNTITHWLSVLEASFLIFRLTPYYENLGKRVIKSPKLYFTDVGLAAYLLEIETLSQLERDPLRGHLFENLVVMELVKNRINQGLDPNLYYFRDSNQNEVDVVFRRGNQLVPVEIKSAKTFNKSFLKGIKYFKNLLGDRVEAAYLIYAGEAEQALGDVKLINYKNLGEVFASESA